MKREGSKKAVIIIAEITVVLLLSVFGYFYKSGTFDFSAVTDFFSSQFSGEVVKAPERSPDKIPSEIPTEQENDAYVPDFMMATIVDTKDTFDLTGGVYSLKNQLKGFSVYLKGMKINTCVFTDCGDDELNAVFSEFFKENGIYACLYFDASVGGEINDRVIIDGVNSVKCKVATINPDAVLICDYKNTKEKESSNSDVLVSDTDKYLTSLIGAVKNENSSVAAGILTGPSKDTELSENYFDIETFFSKDIADFTVVEMPYTMNDADVYRGLLNYWNSLLDGKKTAFFTELYNDKILTGGNWTNPVEMTKQVIESTKVSGYRGFLFRSLKSLIANKQSSTSSLVKYINEDLSAESVLKELTMKCPTQKAFTTNEESIMFQGTTDANYAVMINGSPAARNSNGDFAYTVNLKVGANRITFEHKGKTIVYTVTRTINVLTEVSPTGYSTLDGKTTVAVSAVAYKDAKVTATLNGKTVSLKADYGSTTGSNTLYCTFNGSITLPASTANDVNLGQILFYANYQGITGSKYGANITVRKTSVPGATKVLTVTNDYLPFTYSAGSTYFYPCPDQVYLPAGTVDYVTGEPFIIKDGADTYTFVNTVSGKRFQTKDVTISDFRDFGENAIKSATCTNGNTTVKFDFEMTWNVPFDIQTDGVSYNKSNFKDQDFNVTNYNPTEMVITFDYTTSVPELSIPENSLFESCSWSKDKNGEEDVYKLILKLKRGKSGSGYTAKYSDGHLLLTFTKPLTATEADNEYGGSLKGQVIAISAGHGGWDSGAQSGVTGTLYYERDINASIALKLKAELEKAGATVVMCDALSNNLPDYRARSKQASAAGAQIHIVIHQNSAGQTATGFECWYYSPYSYILGEYLQDAMENFYKDTLYEDKYASYMDRGVFFSWISDTVYPDSPTVLIETGFISNAGYCSAIINDSTQEALVKELVKGIVKYAKS